MIEVKFKIPMKLTDRLGVQILTGRALKNYHRMQLRPKYNRYRARMKMFAEVHPDIKVKSLMSFNEFYDHMRINKGKQTSFFEMS